MLYRRAWCIVCVCVSLLLHQKACNRNRSSIHLVDFRTLALLADLIHHFAKFSRPKPLLAMDEVKVLFSGPLKHDGTKSAGYDACLHCFFAVGPCRCCGHEGRKTSNNELPVRLSSFWFQRIGVNRRCGSMQFHNIPDCVVITNRV